MVNSSVEAKERIRRIEKQKRREIPRCEENKQLIKGTGLETENEQQQLFLCYPPEKSVGNMLQRKNILLTAS